ncbi:hypothetical protein [Sulfurirhabdus autotrophica]|uniref:Uncharacterized protein n=1 Tax=Sulfurirhabdus autotrophica TaxID=1706046 RepID=A0A4R3YFB8_9PROT|nr:hypothetical protein [Sulfurirhabdus autotrophica]TCV90800.1 hypothetical protein EDC63_101774 [Sulfurirhabdus autotrophica]
MLEYIFFDQGLLGRFMDYSNQLGVVCSESEDSMGLIVLVPENLPEDLALSLEQFYDQLLEEQSQLVEQEDGGLVKHAAGIRVTLNDGRPCMVRLEPEMANRLLEVFTLDEVQALVVAIAKSVESADDGPVCHP